MTTEAKSGNLRLMRLTSPTLDINIPYRSMTLQMWTLVCATDKKPGIIVLLQYLLNSKKAEKIVSKLTAVGLYRNSFGLLLAKLDLAFQSEDIEDAYNIYSKFSYLTYQSDGLKMNDFIIQFDNLNHLMKNQGMKLKFLRSDS